MTEKTERASKTYMTGPAARIASMIVFERGMSGRRAGVAVCASKGATLAGRARSESKIFMLKVL